VPESKSLEIQVFHPLARMNAIEFRDAFLDHRRGARILRRSDGVTQFSSDWDLGPLAVVWTTRRTAACDA
jgi:hypothetical protein